MPGKNKQPRIPLPKSWGTHVKSAVLHVIALGQYALTYSRSWAADSTNQRVRLKAENDRLEQELVLRQEELRIKNARMARMTNECASPAILYNRFGWKQHRVS